MVNALILRMAIIAFARKDLQELIAMKVGHSVIIFLVIVASFLLG